MFTVDERDRIREQLLALAAADPAVVAAAVTGSAVTGSGDRWSDIDLALGVDGPLHDTIDRWTRHLHTEHAVVHHWDLPAGAAVYRVYLLPGGLEIDLGFTPIGDFAQRGRRWQLLFGDARPPHPPALPTHDHLAGLAWHHALHARVAIGRGRWWQAQHWIDGARAKTVELACLRLGHPVSDARGAHLLPAAVTSTLDATLVRSVDEGELRRALAATVEAFLSELEHTDSTLAQRLGPVLRETG